MQQNKIDNAVLNMKKKWNGEIITENCFTKGESTRKEMKSECSEIFNIFPNFQKKRPRISLNFLEIEGQLQFQKLLDDMNYFLQKCGTYTPEEIVFIREFYTNNPKCAITGISKFCDDFKAKFPNTAAVTPLVPTAIPVSFKNEEHISIPSRSGSDKETCDSDIEDVHDAYPFDESLSYLCDEDLLNAMTQIQYHCGEEAIVKKRKYYDLD